MISHYLLDTDAIINYVNYYASIDGLAGVHHMMAWLILEGRVSSLVEAKQEIRQKTDDAADWVRDTNMRFEPTSNDWLPAIARLQGQHRSIAKPRARYNADPILLACVLEHMEDGDPGVEKIIVTHDSRLQSVCEQENIRAIDLPELLRRELETALHSRLPLRTAP